MLMAEKQISPCGEMLALLLNCSVTLQTSSNLQVSLSLFLSFCNAKNILYWGIAD